MHVDDIILVGTLAKRPSTRILSPRSLLRGRIKLEDLKHLQEQINLHESSKANHGLLLQDCSEATPNEEHKVLEVPWNPDSFSMLANLAGFAVGLHPTKRNVVGFVGKFYDPLGLGVLIQWNGNCGMNSGMVE